MNIEHTPGPWVVYNARADQNGTPVLTLTSIHLDPACVHEGVWVADIRAGRPDHGGDMSLSTGYANARLVAAAPDLLAALVDALAEMEDSIKAGDDPEDYPPASLIERMKAAIARATRP